MSYALDVSRFAHGPMLVSPERRIRVFALTLAGSIALHIAVLVLGPGLRRGAEAPPRPLEVSIVQPPVPEPVKPPPRVQPLLSASPPQIKPIARTQPEPRRQPAPAPVVQQRQVLAVPEQAAAAPSTFTIAQAEPQPPAPEAKPATVAAAPGPREVPATPALYNAEYLRNAPPRYPLIARRNGVEGTVRLKVFVSKDGKPAQVQLDRSSGSAALDGAALDAVKNWQFVPARRGPEPVESWVLVPVVFRLEGTS
jgi:protein TonB